MHSAGLDLGLPSGEDIFSWGSPQGWVLLLFSEVESEVGSISPWPLVVSGCKSCRTYRGSPTQANS